MIRRVLPVKFKSFRLSDDTFFIPEDIDLKIPQDSNLNDAENHFLVYIPWNDSYLKYVKEDYLDFFKKVLPYLHCRTTDVHVAVCLPFIEYFVRSLQKKVQERAVYLSFILHDIGWSQLTPEEIADSLRVQGLGLSNISLDSKERHAVLGADLSKKMLEDYYFNLSLNKSEKELIYKAVLYHDKIKDLEKGHETPFELKIVADVDHLWSFTRQNFWQDTIRKDVSPADYLGNLKEDLNGYFLTEPGKDKARKLILKREVEVKAWASQMNHENIELFQEELS